MRVPFRTRVSLAAYRARKEIGRYDNATVRQARRLARRSRRGPIDVAWFGDSASSFVGPDDQDRRRLVDMVREELDGTFVSAHGPSYKPALYSGFVRMLDESKPPPIVVFPLCVRVHTVPWIEHPYHGHQQAIDFLSRLDSRTPLRKIRMGVAPTTPEEWARFHALPHPTWLGDLTVGDYVKRARGLKFEDEERARILYAYHHGGRVEDGAILDTVTAFGKQLRERGIRVVTYDMAIPVAQGVEFYGEGFRDLAERNLTLVRDAFLAGYGDVPVISGALTLRSDQFIDPRDASEHMNDRGRKPLADAIVERIKELLADS